MYDYNGEILKDYVESDLENIKNERYLLNDLDAFVNSGNNRKICCLYGLRRTGKSIMMLHEIKHINDYNKCLLVICDNGESVFDLKKFMSKYEHCDYFFIDEVTKLRDFINTCSFLADHYASLGKKVVVTGTDSLGFLIASNGELFDRVEFIQTTYISFKEYNHLLSKDILKYMEYGGTLTDGIALYNRDRGNVYINSAISENISNSLKKWNQCRNEGYNILGDLIERNQLPTIINKVIEYNNRTFLSNVINKDFTSHDLGSLIDLLTKNDFETAHWDKDELNEKIRICLGIKNELYHYVDKNIIDAIIEYLVDLDVLYYSKTINNQPLYYSDINSYTFTQCGLRYAQCDALADALIYTDFFNDYSHKQQKMILDKMKSDIRGGLLEDIVYCQIAKDFDKNIFDDNFVTSYRNKKGAEFDLVIGVDSYNSLIAIEVKLSEIPCDEQVKHLRNIQFCKEVENFFGYPIKNKVVLYRGQNQMSPAYNDIVYINVETFLCNSIDLINYLAENEIKSIEDIEKKISEISPSEHFLSNTFHSEPPKI